MNPEMKTKWTSALRSGDYPQTRGRLTRTDSAGNSVGHCCLGVLCEILVDEGEMSTELDAFRHRLYRTPESVMSSSLSISVLNGLGMTPDEETQLIELNDSDCASFDKIADWIDENL
jgi:hypothetical protein